MLHREEDTYPQAYTYTLIYVHKHTNKNCLLCQQGEVEVSTPGIKPQQILSINHLSFWLYVASRQLDWLQDSHHRNTDRRSLKGKTYQRSQPSCTHKFSHQNHGFVCELTSIHFKCCFFFSLSRL